MRFVYSSWNYPAKILKIKIIPLMVYGTQVIMVEVVPCLLVAPSDIRQKKTTAFKVMPYDYKIPVFRL